MNRDGKVLFAIDKDTGDQVHIVIECADHKPLVVQKSPITRHSDYFRACLKHDFWESRSSTIQVLEVDAELMTLYLSFAHIKVKKSPELGSVGTISITDFLTIADWPRLINLYQLLGYIQNEELLEITGRVIQQVISFGHCSVLTPATEGAEVDRCFEAYAEALTRSTPTIQPRPSSEMKWSHDSSGEFIVMFLLAVITR
ncbi:hypothetical protein BDP55DRAFT_725583 [Colletotrichum godetiae]|uniref:BTB domain-containing protein n=1 Tax=Colletotrichum godetiae TaxID=1209918 RepID=A0AAJ0EW21_9PEZI|nr:uncharacterized protein BDP55DRAFT_725583 [Colletotrichum godetiae]KAK1689409.1 hypothetical protein BDP55DRAFT_725583 [Colletotrichum godetiae]